MNTLDAFLVDLGLGAYPGPAISTGGSRHGVDSPQTPFKAGGILAADAAFGTMLNLAIYLGLQDGVLIIDGSNRFDLHYVAYGLRRFTPRWERGAKQTLIVRAFTCYEMVKALEKCADGSQPILVMDMLSTFYDEAVTDRQSQLLAKRCLAAIGIHKQTRPVVVTLSPPRADQNGRAELNSLVLEEMDNTHIVAPEQDKEEQIALI